MTASLIPTTQAFAVSMGAALSGIIANAAGLSGGDSRPVAALAAAWLFGTFLASPLAALAIAWRLAVPPRGRAGPAGRPGARVAPARRRPHRSRSWKTRRRCESLWVRDRERRARSPRPQITLAHPGATRRAIRHLKRVDPTMGKLIARGRAVRVPAPVRRRTLRSPHAGHRLPAAFGQGGRDDLLACAGPLRRPPAHTGRAGRARRPPASGAPGSRGRRSATSRTSRGARPPDGLPLDALDALPDEAAIEALTAVRGVGAWTAQMFLMFRLGRLDVLPVLDLGIQKGMRHAYGLRRLPKARPDGAHRRHLAPVPQRRLLVPVAGARGSSRRSGTGRPCSSAGGGKLIPEPRARGDREGTSSASR